MLAICRSPVGGRETLDATTRRVGIGTTALALVFSALSGVGAPALAADTAAADAAPGEVSELLVTARRSTEAQVAAPTPVTVMSAEDLQRLPNVSVVDALQRLAGVSVAPTDFFGSPSAGNHGGLDGAARGGGSFVYLRGLSGSYNVNLVNGANAAQGMPYSREIELDLLPPVGLNAIVVSKTSTADMDGDAIGGTIDLRTASAFDFKAQHLGLYVQAGLSEYARDYHSPADAEMVQVEGARRFGANDQFGVYAAAYYGDRHFASTMVDFQAGQWEFAVSDGEQGANPAGFAKKDNLLLSSANTQFTEGDQERYGGALSLDWRGDTTRLYARSVYAVSNIRQNVYQKGIQADHYSAPTVRPDGLYQNAENDGEYHYWFETSPSQSALATTVIGGETVVRALDFEYSGFASWGKSAAPDHAEVTYQTPSDQDLNGPFQVTYRNGYPIPLLSAAQLGRLNNNALYLAQADSGEFTASRSTQVKVGGRFDVTWTRADAGWRTLKAGLKLVRSDRDSTSRDYSNLNFVPAGQPLSESSLFGRTVGAIDNSYYPYNFRFGDGDRLTQLAREAALGQTLSADDFNKNTLSGQETVLSAYTLANFQHASLEVQPGLRFERTWIGDRFWNSVEADGATTLESGFATSRTEYSLLLPSLHVNYRPSGSSVLRAAVWRSYTRPAFFQLAGGRQTTVNSDGTIDITEGNPDLKPVKAWNFDLSAEHARDGFSVSAALFYKALDDYLYDRGSSFRAEQIAQSGVASISRPVNGGSANMYGLELAARYQLTGRGDWSDGFGVSGNLTLQRSHAHLEDDSTDASQPMQGVPELLYNAAFFYEHGGLTANLAYRYSGALVAAYRFGTWGGKDLNDTQRATRSVDASVGYALADGGRLTLAASNLLDDVSYYRTVGPESDEVPQIVRWGRTFTVTFSKGF